MARTYNFSAGPAALPETVLSKVQEQMLEWGSAGMSVMEMSHRGKDFMQIAQAAEADLRELLSVPDNYKVLFLQGGATQQFSALPLNLSGPESSAAYILTGSWGKKALAEGARFCCAEALASSSETGFDRIPDLDSLTIDENAAYVHITSNETIGGVEYWDLPDTGSVPLVADMSSNILSRPVDVSKFGLIYAGAQKNIGPAGLTIVIVRDDLLGKAQSITPSMLNYEVQASAGSMSNTPPTFAWYFAGLVFRELLELGGLTAAAERNKRKAEALYQAIDNSDFYANPVQPKDRSYMNVPFTLADASLDGDFLAQAESRGLKTLKGHRSVGGMRASIYNAMPEAGVQALVDFMADFEKSQA